MEGPKNENVKYFKNRARNCIYIYQKRSYLDKQIEELEYRIKGISAVDSSKTHDCFDPKQREYANLVLMEKKDILVARKRACDDYIRWIFRVVSRCPKDKRPYIVSIYLERKKIEAISEEAGIPMTRMSHDISVALNDVITEKDINMMDGIMSVLSEHDPQMAKMI